MSTFESNIRFSPANLFTPGVVVLIVLLIVGFLLSLLAGAFTGQNLLLNPSAVLGGKIWQLISYPFINCPLSLVFNRLIVLFIGSAIEREWKTKSFLLLWLVVSVVCGFIWSVISWMIGANYVGGGASACTYGLLGAFGLLFRGTNCFAFFGMLKAQMITWICLAIGVIMSITVPITLLWLLGAAVAYGYIKLIWKIPSRKKKVSSGKTSGSFVEID